MEPENTPEAAETVDEPKKRGRPAKAPEAAEVPMFDCTVLRDYWAGDTDESRVRAGAVVSVDAAAAIDGIERGILARVK